MQNPALFSYNENSTSEQKAVAAWLINLRWLALVAQLFSLIPGLKLGLVLSAHVTQYLAIVLLLALFNLSSAIFNRKNPLDVKYSNLCQLLVDLIALTLLLSISAAKDNPMIALFYLHPAIGAMVLRRWQSLLYLFCLQVGVSYALFMGGLTVLASGPPVLSAGVKLIAQLFLVTIIWLLMSSLSWKLSDLRTRLSKLANHQRRIENLRVLGASTASFSHLFATPLNTIKLRVNRLIRFNQDLPASLSADISSLCHAVDQCEQVLRSFFEVTNKEDRALMRSVEISDFLQAVCIEWSVDKVKVRLDFRVDANFPEHVRCKIPELAFARNIIDLLDNACEASQSQLVEICVEIRLNHQMVEIKFTDNGPGMPASVKDRLGEPFITTKEDGSGLGLFTALSMAQALGGDLRIIDGVERGTSIILTIPSFSDVRPVNNE